MLFAVTIDRVTFVYETDGKEKRFSVSSAEAGKYIGSDIKSHTVSVTEIRKLLDTLEIE